MRRRSWTPVLLVAAVALLALGSGRLRAEESAPADSAPAEPTQGELQARAKRVKQDAAEHKAGVEKAAAARAEELAAMGIQGVAALDEPGDSARCLDLAIIGDGFTKEEQEEYRKVVDRMAQNFDTPPFDAYRRQLNLHRIDLVSPESGISLEGAPVATPLGGTVQPFVGGKLLACDARAAVRLARAAVPEMDYLMVVLNTHGKFLGSANSGSIFLLSTAGGHQRSIVVHEFGHNFGHLLDEYVDPKQAGDRAPPAGIRQARNVGLESNVHAAKWHYWNIPEAVFRGVERVATFSVEDNVRCYEGGATFPDGVYRPEENCHMQRGRGKAFCRVCAEGLEIALYRFFEPLEEVSPPVQRLALAPQEALAFSVRPVVPAGKDDRTLVRWYLDGTRLPAKAAKVVAADDGGGPRYVLALAGRSLAESTHHLTVDVEFLTPRVRMDLGRQSASYTWTIDVGGGAQAPRLPTKVTADVGVPIELTAGGGEAEAWMLVHGPQGASYDAASGAVAWTPAATQEGAWTFTFARAGADQAPVTVPVRVRPAAKRPNRGPAPVFHAPLAVTAGASHSFVLRAFDPDGDHLAWSAEALPDGASLDPNTGAVAWQVPRSALGRRELAFTCTDGLKRLDVTVPVEIEGLAAYRGLFDAPSLEPMACDACVDRMLLGLHHALPLVRLANARALADAPPTARLAEALRLWREQTPSIVAWARETLEQLFAQDAAVRRACLDLVLDVMQLRVWQFVDRPEDCTLVGALVAQALETEGITREQRRALEALKADLEHIAAYGSQRLAKQPVPPITDKKYR